MRRGVYRLVHFPAGEHEDLTALWLWSHQHGVYSHQTAQALHDLSDAMPSRLQLTLPIAWRRRRLRIPEGVELHYGEVPEAERCWFGPVPVTASLRTLDDCADEHLPPDQLRQATRDALRRGLVTRAELARVDAALAPFGGLP